MYSRTALQIACLAAAGLLGTVAATSSLAQTASPGSGVILTSDESTPAQHLINDKWVISAGTFILSSSLDGNFNGNANPTGQKVNFDQDFGTNSDVTVARAGVLWRWKPRHHLRFEFSHNKITGTRTLDKNIDWGDYTFLANASVGAKNTFDVYELSYEYAFMRGPTYEVAAAAGMHFLNQKLQLNGDATITQSDGTVAAQVTRARRVTYRPRCRSSACAVAGRSRRIGISTPPRRFSKSRSMPTTVAGGTCERA